MSLSADEKLRLTQVVAPLLIPYLRSLRALGFDPRTTAKARYQDATLTPSSTVQLDMIRALGPPLSSATLTGINAGEMCEMIDAAAALI